MGNDDDEDLDGLAKFAQSLHIDGDESAAGAGRSREGKGKKNTTATATNATSSAPAKVNVSADKRCWTFLTRGRAGHELGE